MQKVGFIGWRGMVGSVLMDRLMQEGDFKQIESYFFSTSQAGANAPDVTQAAPKLLDAQNINELKQMDILISCQGGDYTSQIHPALRNAGWKGYWVDAASTLRMNSNACIILEPVNGNLIRDALKQGCKDFVGGNCTVSLMLIALDGLFKENLVEWVSSMTYQAASGAGAKQMLELLSQMQSVGRRFSQNPALGALEVEKSIQQHLMSNALPIDAFGYPLALNLLPWIDSELPNGQSREEWKGQVEANKILQTQETVFIDGTCVRVGAMRCHSQGLTIKLKKSVELNSVEAMLAEANPWVKLVPNHKVDSLSHLTPVAVSGQLQIPIGRVRKMTMGDKYLNAFTCGDQLLWGAAEPLRCMLKVLVES